MTFGILIIKKDTKSSQFFTVSQSHHKRNLNIEESVRQIAGAFLYKHFSYLLSKYLEFCVIMDWCQKSVNS